MKNFNMSPSSAGSATAVARWGTAAARCAPLRARPGSPTWAAGCPPRCAGDAGSGWASVGPQWPRWPRWENFSDFYGKK